MNVFIGNIKDTSFKLQEENFFLDETLNIPMISLRWTSKVIFLNQHFSLGELKDYAEEESQELEYELEYGFMDIRKSNSNFFPIAFYFIL